MGTIAMMIARDSAYYAARDGSAEAPHMSATEAANGASKSPTAVTAATMTASGQTRAIYVICHRFAVRAVPYDP
jgi:hypothetical protein